MRKEALMLESMGANCEKSGFSESKSRNGREKMNVERRIESEFNRNRETEWKKNGRKVKINE